MSTRGAQFGAAFDPAEVISEPWGSATLRFSGCDRAVLEYAGGFSGGGQESGMIVLQRFTEGLYDFECIDP